MNNKKFFKGLVLALGLSSFFWIGAIVAVTTSTSSDSVELPQDVVELKEPTALLTE